jgi:hypothetical protein
MLDLTLGQPAAFEQSSLGRLPGAFTAAIRLTRHEPKRFGVRRLDGGLLRRALALRHRRRAASF